MAERARPTTPPNRFDAIDEAIAELATLLHATITKHKAERRKQNARIEALERDVARLTAAEARRIVAADGEMS